MDAVERGYGPQGIFHGTPYSTTHRSKDPHGLHHDGAGLYLQIKPGGARSWIYRFRLNSRTARDKASAARALVKDGIDPIEHTRAQAIIPAAPKRNCSPTFEEVAESYMADRLKRVCEARFTVTSGDRRLWTTLNEIETNDVLAVLKPIWESKCETAARLRGRIERILARATVEGHRSGANPATWRGHLQEARPDVGLGSITDIEMS